MTVKILPGDAIAEMARKRIEADAGLFATVETEATE